MSLCDGYSRQLKEIVSHIPNKTKCIDDTCLWPDNLTESFLHAVGWLDLFTHNGIILNPDKFEFGADTVRFVGFEITPDSVQPCKKYLHVIHHFPRHLNIPDIQSWSGHKAADAVSCHPTGTMMPDRLT